MHGSEIIASFIKNGVLYVTSLISNTEIFESTTKGDDLVDFTINDNAH